MNSPSSERRGLRWWMFPAFVGLTILVASRFAGAQQLAVTLRRGRMDWVFVALLLHLLYFVMYAGFYQVGFRTVAVENRLWNLVPLVFVSLFVNSLVPSGGVGGAAVFVDDAVQRGQSGVRTVVGVVWVFVADILTLVPFIIYACLFLYQNQELKFYDLIGAGIFISIGVVICLLFALAHWLPNLLYGLLRLVERVVDRAAAWLRHPGWLGKDWPLHTSAEISLAVNNVLSSPRWMMYTMLIGLGLHILNLVGLYALFLAFSQPVRLGTLISGFGMGIVFFVITIIPQGVGAVEGIMTLVFNSLGIPNANALVITLVFRGLNFWLPLLIGFISIRSLSRFKRPIRQTLKE
jgi:uncharacterized protein (TIRG00374 family)